MNSFRPLIVFILNFIVGYLVTQGVVDSKDHNVLVDNLADALGYLIIAATSLASIVHVFKKPHSLVPEPVTTQTTVKTETKQEATYTQPVPQEFGTPPGYPLPQ